MAEPLKRFFDRALVARIGAMLADAHPRFPRERFETEANRGLARLELLDRARHIARAMRVTLPDDFEKAADILVRSLGPELDRTDAFGMNVFLYLPHVVYVAEHGRDHFEASMRAQYELTKRFSAEFSIRTFLEHDPKRTLARLAEWARDPNPHVRRLVSEGTRPRLPWAPRIRSFQRDPRPVIALLELLKDDPDLYVRRSVANNLNDIGKDHPEVLVEICARWLEDASDERRWIVKHALRWLVKRGHAAALEVLGFGGARGVTATATCRPARVRMGGSSEVTVRVRNDGARVRTVLVDLAVHFVRASGKTNAKVFKLRTVTLAAGAESVLTKRISFAKMTTRRHHPGRHRVDVLLNGRAQEVASIVVLPSPA